MIKKSKKLIHIGASIICVLLLVVMITVVNYVKAVTNNELYGYACNIITGQTNQFSGKNIGCISLSHISATGEYATNTTHQVYFTRTVSTGTSLGEFSGTGYNPRIGEVKFGESCPNEPGFTSAMQTGKQCAKLVDVAGSTTSADVINTGWGKFIYVGNITHTLGSEKLSGIGWQAYNTDGINLLSDVGIGKLDFGTAYWTKLGCTQSIAINYDSTATVNDNSCNFPSVCGGANTTVYPYSTGLSMSSPDLCGVNNNLVNNSFTSTNPSNTTGTFTWSCKSITPSVNPINCSATWDPTSIINGGGGTGTGTGTPSKPINPGFKET